MGTHVYIISLGAMKDEGWEKKKASTGQNKYPPGRGDLDLGLLEWQEDMAQRKSVGWTLDLCFLENLASNIPET